jgi:hypothetical protein
MRSLLLSISFLFAIATLFSSVQTMLHSSFAVGTSAIAATAFAFIGASTFVGSALARKEKTYSAFDLVGIGAIALIFISGGFVLAYWSGFQINVAGYATVDGFNCLVVALVLGLFVVRKQDAL